MSNKKQIMHPQEIDYSTLLLGPQAEVQGAVFLIWSISDIT
jgi:hypothetical protein